MHNGLHDLLLDGRRPFCACINRLEQRNLLHPEMALYSFDLLQIVFQSHGRRCDFPSSPLCFLRIPFILDDTHLTRYCCVAHVALNGRGSELQDFIDF